MQPCNGKAHLPGACLISFGVSDHGMHQSRLSNLIKKVNDQNIKNMAGRHKMPGFWTALCSRKRSDGHRALSSLVRCRITAWIWHLIRARASPDMASRWLKTASELKKGTGAVTFNLRRRFCRDLMTDCARAHLWGVDCWMYISRAYSENRDRRCWNIISKHFLRKSFDSKINHTDRQDQTSYTLGTLNVS